MNENNIDSIKIEIIVTTIGYEVVYHRGDEYSMKARDFGISKKAGLIGDLLSNNILSTLDYLQSDIDMEFEEGEADE